MSEVNLKMMIYVERKVIYSGGSVLPAVSFENVPYILIGRVYFEVKIIFLQR